MQGLRMQNSDRAKISDATFDILTFYIEEYKELILKQEYLFINVSGDYAGKPFKVSGSLCDVTQAGGKDWY